MIEVATTVATVHMRRSALEAMLAHARATPARECCGALLGARGSDGRRVERVVPAPNADPDTRRAYLMDAAAIRRIERQAAAARLDVVGFYHSHPDGSVAPSSSDLEAAWPWFTYLIVGDARAPAVSAWRLRADRTTFEPEELEWVE
ncbi:MAG TPA: M67 family metallopeptidase [Longimicrobiales bacterium]|nr:M67 family metallopeptidase [Longimicrobiales bacterium]